MAESDLLRLADEISTNTRIVNDYVQAKGITLSLAVGGVEAFPLDAPDEILLARRIVREASKELSDLVEGPSERVRWLALRHHDVSSLRWVYRFKLADAVPQTGSITFADLARKVGASEKHVKTVVRHAMTNDVFYEPQTGLVAHTAASTLLKGDSYTCDWVGYATDESFLGATKLVEASMGSESVGETGQAAFNIAYDTPLPFFEHIAPFPERVKRFANTMKELRSTDGVHVRHVVSGFPWAELPSGSTVIDVGGSSGHVSIAIAERARSLNFVVQDRAEIIAQGQEYVHNVADDQVRERIRFEAHDFYSAQPARSEVSVYFLRFILHDYPDESAVKILRAIVPGLSEGARIVVAEGITPGPRVLPRSEERINRTMDMEMTTMFDALEREREQWESLFRMADSRLHLKSVQRPVGSVASVMEVVFEGGKNA